jgi:glycerol-3-phosphate dehydrogenase
MIECDRLWAMASHIVWPLGFVLPQTWSPQQV